MAPDHPEDTHPEDGHRSPEEEGRQPGAGESESILAAVGWETDPRRRKILRRLLQQHCQRVYLHSFAANHNRASAMDQTRRALLHTARTLDDIPDSCSLSIWIFVELMKQARRSPECPDPARVLMEWESAQTGAGRADRALPAGAGVIEGMEGAGCKELIDGFRGYRSHPSDANMLERSGWKEAEGDLNRYLDAQFGDEHPEAVRAADYWKQVMPRIRLTRSGMVAGLVATAAVALALILLIQWHDHGGGGPQDRDRQGAEPAHRDSAGPAHTIPDPAPITGVTIEISRSKLVLAWSPSAGVDAYRLSILTAKLKMLRVVEDLSNPSVELSITEVPGLEPGESYLFRVDGTKEGVVVSSTGYTPFNLR